MPFDVHEPRQEVIHRHLRTAIAQGLTTQEGYADAFRQHYESALPARVRTIALQDPEQATSPSRALASNAKHVRSWFDPERTVRMPVEAEEPAVDALPEPMRTECRRELGWRLGLWGSIRREMDAGGDHCCFGDLAQEFGELSQIAGQMLANGGELGPQDAHQLPELLRQARTLQASVQAFIERAEWRVGGEENVTSIEEGRSCSA